MKHANWFGQKAIWLCLVATVAGGSFLIAADGMMSKEEMKTHIMNAKSAADHEALAKHFDAKADQLEADSKEHMDMAAEYRKHPTIHEMKHQMSGQTAGHCTYFANQLHKSSLAARQMAADHRAMAKEAK